MPLSAHLGERCRTCPLPPGEACAGVDAPRLCQLVDPRDPDYTPAYRSVLAPAPAAPQPLLRPLSEVLSLRLAMRLCPDRDPAPDCGCVGAARCLKGRGSDGLVGARECFECLSPR